MLSGPSGGPQNNSIVRIWSNLYRNTPVLLSEYIDKPFDGRRAMPKVSLDVPQQLLDDLKIHVGDEGKFVSVADAIRTACRKMLDQLDAIDARHGRLGDD